MVSYAQGHGFAGPDKAWRVVLSAVPGVCLAGCVSGTIEVRAMQVAQGEVVSGDPELQGERARGGDGVLSSSRADHSGGCA